MIITLAYCVSSDTSHCLPVVVDTRRGLFATLRLPAVSSLESCSERSYQFGFRGQHSMSLLRSGATIVYLLDGLHYTLVALIISVPSAAP